MESNDREYSNGEITVYWLPKKCIHATTCYTQLSEVFNPRNRPWVNMNGASSERIIEIVKKCPTDALTYKWSDENHKDPSLAQPVEQTVQPAEIQIMKDGPILVTGKIMLTDNEGKEYKTYSITSFCRCGASNNMPFCDGTHRKIAFEG
jgi:uncharacterized Fe-S cluster protein YjdI